MKTKIYFICPSNKFASGGVKQIYRQVKTLNENGYEASILLKKKGREEKWFDTNVPIKYHPHLFKRLKYLFREKKISIWKRLQLLFLKKISAKLENNSIIVFPEIYGPYIQDIEPQISKVIFNQNCFYTFDYYSIHKNYNTNPYKHPKTIATIVASQIAENYLKYSFPNAKILKMRLGIDSNIFQFSEVKKKQIAFMPRKLGEDVGQVINILKSRNSLKDWSLIAIDDKSEKEVAQIMQDSAIFLSFNHKEGFGLPPVEAMACGCYVIGYTGQGGKEYFDPQFSSPIEDGNIIDFVKTIEETINIFEINPSQILSKGKLASNFVSENYSLLNETTDTLDIWRTLID